MLTEQSSDSSQLRITEIFHSLQGEATRVGLPTVFVRLTGCPLRCVWCDTAYAFEGGSRMSISDIVGQVAEAGTPHVTVTGGEPLAQPGCLQLLNVLSEAGFDVSLETSGALAIDKVDSRVSRIMDLKPPSSGEVARNLWSNIPHLNQRDEVKFVIGDESDYQWSRSKLIEHDLSNRVGAVLFSPVQDHLSPALLAQWILGDKLPVRMQLQMHKIIWGQEQGR